MTQRTWLGLDVGGANIKVANTSGYARSETFCLWKQPERLADQLSKMIAAAPTSNSVVATMTGELADCYRTKKEGVQAIVNALCQSVADTDLFIYLTDGSIVPPHVAKHEYRAAAASNWHALASYSLRLVGSNSAILVDIGSTTCDVVPISKGKVAAAGRTDTERLRYSELVYLGIERTPICSIASHVPYRGSYCPVAREFFATSVDAYIILGNIPESSDRTDTADGRPATIQDCIQRLGRCICADQDEFDIADARHVAHYIRQKSAHALRAAIDSVTRQHGFDQETSFILSGHGDFLFDQAHPEYSAKRIRLRDEIGESAARCATAFAVAAVAEAAARH